MIKFKDYEYKRLDMDQIREDFTHLIEKFEASSNVEEQNKVMKEINVLREEVETAGNLVYIRHSINTEDEFYEKEQEFIDENMPLYEEVMTKYYKALVNSKFRSELEEKWGSHLFNLAEMQLKTFSPEIIEDLIKENKLVSEYAKLIASAKIMFEGEERNLSQMQPFMQSKDREERKKAYEAYTSFFEENEGKFDEIYDNLVKVRDGMAKKLGFKNFVELGYARMSRTDYNKEMVANYRKQVEEDSSTSGY